jgi:glycosyltransferase involved in cell wall biosynthesis
MAANSIIYAAVCGITDVVIEYVHGLGVKPNDQLSISMALDRLLGNAELRRRMGKSAAELADSCVTRRKTRSS